MLVAAVTPPGLRARAGASTENWGVLPMSDRAAAMATDERAAVCICHRSSHTRRCDRHAATVADLYALVMSRAQARMQRDDAR